MENNSSIKKPKKHHSNLTVNNPFPEVELNEEFNQSVENNPYIEKIKETPVFKDDEIHEAEFEEIPNESISLFQRNDQPTIDSEEEFESDEVEMEEEPPPYPTHSFEEGASPDIEKLRRRKPLNSKIIFNIFAICLLIAIAFVLSLKVLWSGDTAEKTSQVSQTDFDSAEEVSVEKARAIIEEANKELDVILSTDNLSEYPTETTAIPSLLDVEEPVVVDGKIEYSNTSQNINFSYPSEWLELMSFTSKERPKNVQNVVMVGRSPESGIVDNMRISIEGTPKSITSKHYFEETEGLMQQVFPKFQLVSTEELTVSGREAPSRIYTWIPVEELERTPFVQEQIALKQQQIYLAGKEKVYVVTFTATATDFDEHYAKYKEILSTLELDN